MPRVSSYETVSPNKDLNVSRDGESAGSAGKLFQSLAILGKKDDAYTWLVLSGVLKRDPCPIVDDVDSVRCCCLCPQDHSGSDTA